MDHRRKDPTFTSYEAKSADEAIELFYKMKNQGEILWDDIDLALQRCARSLPNQEEHDKFVQFICNPSSVQPGDMKDCFPASGVYPTENSLPKMIQCPEEKTPE